MVPSGVPKCKLLRYITDFTFWPNHLIVRLYRSFPLIMRKSGVKSSSGRGNHNGDGRAEDPTCAVCMSDEFYEDEQGGMICVACGTQSQDFLAEGFDEDDLAVYGGGTGNIVTLKNASGKGLNSVEESKTRKVDLVPDILEALKLYQFVLQMVFDACLVASNKASPSISEQELNATNAIYRNTLKTVWMDYLNRWNTDHTLEPTYHQALPCASQNDKRARFRPVKKCSVGCGFTRSAKYQCKCQDAGSVLGHPLFPSKPLILGFVYLTYRVMRSDVLVSDIVRWCEAGMVPYLNLWENIPQKWRDTVKVDMKWFYDTTNKRISLTPSSILFHACSIAQVIRIDPTLHAPVDSLLIAAEHTSVAKNRTELPPLNAPLVAHKIITSLGLPNIVWENYVKITQLFTGGAAMNHANMLEQHHELYILSVIIIAIKCSPNWIEWSLVKDPPSNIHSGIQSMGTKHAINDATIILPEHAQDLSTLTRAELPVLLAQIRRINQLHSLHTDTHKTQFLYNNAVFTALGGDAEKINKGEGQYTMDQAERDRNHPQHSQSQYSQYSQHSHYSQSSYHSTSNINTGRALHTTAVPHFHHTTNTDTTVSMNNVVVYGDSMITEDLSLRERRLLNFINGIEPNPRGKKGNSGQKSAYMAYTRYDSDRTSVHHIPYVTLLERCSKYLYVNVQLLHNLVTVLEKQIVNLSFNGATDLSATATNRKKKDLHNLHTNAANTLTLNTISDAYGKHYSKKERLMQKYRIKYEQKLPEAHKQGLATLHHPALTTNKRKHSSMSQNNPDTDGYSSDDSRESYHSISHITKAVEPIQPFVFDAHGDFADVEDLFGFSHIVHRVDAPVGKRVKRVKTANTTNTTNTTTTNDITNITIVDGPTANTSTTTTTATTIITNTPKTSSYLTYDSSGASGYDTDTNHPHTPPGSPRPLEFDLLHAYTTTQAGERTPPISEITYSRTPFSTVRPTYSTMKSANRLPEMHIFHTAGVSLAEKPAKKRNETPHVAAMEALDRLVSAQDSASDSEIPSEEEENDSEEGESEYDRSGNKNNSITGARKEKGKPVTGNSSRVTNAGNVRGAPLFDSPVANNPALATKPTSYAPVNVPVVPTAAPAPSGMSLLARAIFGHSATSSTSATVVPTSSVAARPVVALKRPRVQFQN